MNDTKSTALTAEERERLLDELARTFARAAVDRLIAEEAAKADHDAGAETKQEADGTD
jgi:hypothetical protein